MQGFGGLYKVSEDIFLGVHIEDVLFVWCEMDTEVPDDVCNSKGCVISICTHCTHRVAGEGIHGLGMCMVYSVELIFSVQPLHPTLMELRELRTKRKHDYFD